ncbi:phage Gp37/Gp68 family protein [Methylocapsa polymorpha]|uniref:Phage Gp37/Gp68 family protein n=1 Tax=Methylocapsa polymorpha TaxID=3080828 RepID=A0ABZ0HSB9_9HYPH|nr:phage Gp37/Gp68 family protein [Methylocapsa sp. RX1]
MAYSEIEWTEATWNPIAGCNQISPGCTNCYAQRMAARLQAMGSTKYAGTTRKSGATHVWSGQINFDESALASPLKWRKPMRIFVNSMSDLFHSNVEDEIIGKVWRIMHQASWHSFQLLTKRPERISVVMDRCDLPVLDNVWLGTSVESQRYVSRIDSLRATPAKIRFVSFEPLLGPIVNPNLEGIHWAIVGGESGPKARPIERSWVEELKDDCLGQQVAFFFKQWGGARKHRSGRLLGGRTWDQYPIELAR